MIEPAIGIMNYKLILVNGKQKYEHRHVMELCLGRKLLRGEIVHHKDRNRRNNDVSNLELTTQSNHVKDHHKRKEIHRIPDDYNWMLRIYKGKRVLVKDKYGTELFVSLSINAASIDTGISISTLWGILNNKFNQRGNYLVSYLK